MTLQELGNKDMIQLKTGENLGRIDDIDFDEETAAIKAVVLRGRRHFFGLLGHDEDLVIPWEKVHSIGTDVVLTEVEIAPTFQPRRKWFW